MHYYFHFKFFSELKNTYPQSCKETERIRDAESARSYSSTVPFLVPAARICCSGATDAHTTSEEATILSTITDSVCFKPLLLTEHWMSSPSENRTNSSRSVMENSSWTIARVWDTTWLDPSTTWVPEEAIPLPKWWDNLLAKVVLLSDTSRKNAPQNCIMIRNSIIQKSNKCKWLKVNIFSHVTNKRIWPHSYEKYLNIPMNLTPLVWEAFQYSNET